MKKTVWIIILVIILSVMAIGLTACKKDKTVTITYFDGNTQLKTEEIELGQTAPNYNPAEKTGYDFEDWFTDAELKNKFDSDSKIEKNIALYAKYSSKTFNIIFKSEVSDDIIRSVAYNKNLTDIPSVPTKIGYTGEWDITNFDNITSDITVTAIYTPITLTLTFKIEGEQDTIKTVLYGQDLTDIPPIAPKTGKIASWSVKDFSNITQSQTINAVYEDIMIKIIFVSQRQEQKFEHIEYVLYGTNFDLSKRPQPHSFIGYTGVWENANYENLIDDLTVNAIYTEVFVDLTVIIDNSSKSITLPYGATPRSYVESKSYQEIGLENENQRQSLLNPVTPDTIDNTDNIRKVRYGNSEFDIDCPLYSNQTFFVVWDVFIAFYTSGGEFEKDSDYVSGQEFRAVKGSYIDQPVMANRYGFNFLGWITNTNEQFDFSQPVLQDTNLYADWEQIYYQVYFPAIEGMNFNYDSSAQIPYGSSFSFSIDTALNILEVKANENSLIKNNENSYLIENIEDDHNIAIKTDDIEIFTLEFYNRQHANIIYSRSVSQGQCLFAVPSVPEVLFATGVWLNEGVEFDFNTEIQSNMSFVPYYTNLVYNIIYYLDQETTIQKAIEYQNTNFEFYSPPRKEGQLFDGWYMDSSLTIRANKTQVASSGNNVDLYAKWIPSKTITSDLIGLWYGDLFILELFNNGMAQIYQGQHFIECSYEILDNTIQLMDEIAIVDNTNIIFRNQTLEKTTIPKSMIYMDMDIKEWYLVDNYTVPYDEEVFGYYWYSDVDFTNRVDITMPLNPDLFTNRQLYLYKNLDKLVILNLDASPGYTEANKTSEYIYVSSNINLNIINAVREGYIFLGWAIEGTTEILTLTYLYNYDSLSLNVYAVYLSQEHFTEEIIEGTYTCTLDNEMFIAEFNYDEQLSYSYYTITTINLIDNTHTISIPFVYKGNDIVVTENSISLNYNQQNLSMQSNSLNLTDYIYTQTAIENEQEIINIIIFDPIAITIKINNNEYNVYQYNGIFYYFVMNNSLEILQMLNINDLDLPSAEVPSQHLGLYEGVLLIEENIFYISLDIILTNECKLSIYADEDKTELINEHQSRFAIDLNGNYIIVGSDGFTFEIDENNNKYYLNMDIIQTELLKV